MLDHCNKKKIESALRKIRERGAGLFYQDPVLIKAAETLEKGLNVAYAHGFMHEQALTKLNFPKKTSNDWDLIKINHNNTLANTEILNRQNRNSYIIVGILFFLLLSIILDRKKVVETLGFLLFSLGKYLLNNIDPACNVFATLRK